MVRTIVERLYELLRNDGIRGAYDGAKRFLWWHCGGMSVEYWLRSHVDRPIRRSIGGIEVSFYFDSFDEFRRIKTLSGEQRPLEWFLGILEPTDTVWDIGANVGVYSIFAARRASEVVAFEPHPANQQRLGENAALNSVDIDVRPVALSDESGTAALDVGVTSAGAGGGKVADEGVYEIELQKGAAIHPAPDVVKVDVEGQEEQALRGMGDRLSGTRTVLVEAHDLSAVDGLRQLLEEHGFDVVRRWTIGTREFLTATSPGTGTE